jgi:hypothetical protein
MVWLGRGVVSVGVMLLVSAVLGSGCDDATPNRAKVTLRVTRDFGRELLAGGRLPLEGDGTPVQLLKQSHDVRLNKYGFVESIEGWHRQTPRSRDPEQQTIWVLNVNGIETDMEPTKLPIVANDVVQFDLRDIETALDVRATVGAFPQTFTGGILGVRFPVTVHCAKGYAGPCGKVRAALRAVGVDPAGEPPAQLRLTKRLRRARSSQTVVRRATVLVGPWNSWRDRRWPRLIGRGPRYSGVFARFSSKAASLKVLDWDAAPSRRMGPGTGLVAAMRPTENDLQWLVTGVDRKGVDRAARALDADTMRDAYAVAVTDDGVEKLPLPPKGH